MDTTTSLSTTHSVKCIVRPVEGPTFRRFDDGSVEEKLHLFERNGAAVNIVVDARAACEKAVWQRTLFDRTFPLYSWRLGRTVAHMKVVAEKLRDALGEGSAGEQTAPIIIESRSGAIDVSVLDKTTGEALWTRTVSAGAGLPKRLTRACHTASSIASSMQGLE